MRSPSGGGSPPRREPTPELNTFAELVRMECNFFADDHDLVGAAELLRLHGIRLPVGRRGEAGLREGLALISWVEIHLLMPGDWEDLPDGVKAQLARLLGADEGSLADQDCIQKLRLKWMLNVQLQTAAVDADAELISLPASEMDTAAHDLAAWLDTPPNRRTPLLRLHTARLPTPPLDDDMPLATPAELAAERAEAAERAAEERLRVEIGRRRRPRQSRRTRSGTAGATKCLSRGSVGSRPGLGGLEEKEKVQRRCPPSLRRNSLV